MFQIWNISETDWPMFQNDSQHSRFQRKKQSCGVTLAQYKELEVKT